MMKKYLIGLLLFMAIGFSQQPITTANLPYYISELYFNRMNIDSVLVADSSAVYIEGIGLIDTSLISWRDQAETITGIWTFSDSAYIDTLAFSRIFGLDSLNVDSLNFVPNLELSDSTAALRVRIESKSDSSLVGYLAQAESITGNWINTDNPWAENELVSSVIVETDINTETKLEALSFEIWAESEIDTSKITFLDQDETITGLHVFSDSAYIDTLEFSRIYGLDSLNVDSLGFVPDLELDNYKTALDTGNIAYLPQDETISGAWLFDGIVTVSDSAYIDTLQFSRIFGLDSLNVDSLNFVSDKDLSDTTTVLRTRIEGKADTALVGYLAQDETITGNWVNTASPWADNEVADNITLDSTKIDDQNFVPDLELATYKTALDTGNVFYLNQDETVTGVTTFSGVVSISDSAFVDTLTTNISNLGTVKTGTWNGTAINDTYIPNDITLDSTKIDDQNFVADAEFTTHKTSSDHDGQYFTETEVGTWRSNVTQTEMSYVDGVTSDIQTQFGAKADTTDNATRTHISAIIDSTYIDGKNFVPDLELVDYIAWTDTTSIISTQFDIVGYTEDSDSLGWLATKTDISNLSIGNYLLKSAVGDSITANVDSSFIDNLNFIPDDEFTTHKTSSDHDGQYYTETESNTFLGAKADTTDNATRTYASTNYLPLSEVRDSIDVRIDSTYIDGKNFVPDLELANYLLLASVGDSITTRIDSTYIDAKHFVPDLELADYTLLSVLQDTFDVHIVGFTEDSDSSTWLATKTDISDLSVGDYLPLSDFADSLDANDDEFLQWIADSSAIITAIELNTAKVTDTVPDSLDIDALNFVPDSEKFTNADETDQVWVSDSTDYLMKSMFNDSLSIQLLSYYGGSLPSAVTAISTTPTTLVVNTAPDNLTANLTIPSTLSLMWLQGNVLSADATTDSLFMNGALIAGDYQIWDSLLVVTDTVKVDKINVKWFGALGDGSHDDTESCQRAINLANNANIVWFPVGNFMVSGLTFYSQNKIHGSGNDTEITLISGSDANVFESGEAIMSYCEFKDLRIDGNSDNNASGSGIYMDSDDNNLWGIIERVNVTKCKDIGIYVNNGNIVTFQDSRAWDCNIGAKLDSCRASNIYNSNFEVNDSLGLYIVNKNSSGVTSANLIGNWFENGAATPAYHLLLDDVNQINVIGNRFYVSGVDSAAIGLKNSSDNNYFFNNAYVNAGSDTDIQIESGANNLFMDNTSDFTGDLDSNTVFINNRLGLGTVSTNYSIHAKTIGANAAIVTERESGAINFINSTATHGTFGTVNNFPLKIVQGGESKIYLDTTDVAIYLGAGGNITASGDTDIDMTLLGNGSLGIGTIEPVNLLNVDGAYNFFADSSSVNDSWGFSTTGLEVLTTGLQVFVQIGVVNTDGATLQINALGAKNVLKNHDVALATGDVEVGQILHLIYDGTSFQMLSQLAQ